MINNLTNFTACNGDITDESLLSFLLDNAPDFISMVPEHWLRQYSPSRDARYHVATAFLVICLPANIGHLLTFVAFGRSRHIRTSSNRLLLSLLFADFILLMSVYLFIHQSFIGVPVFGVVGCKIGGFMGSVAAIAEIWSLSFVSYDRYHGVCYPLNQEKRFSKSQANKTILMLWASSMIISLFPLFGWSRYVTESYLMGCAFDIYSSAWTDRAYFLFLFTLCYLIPLCIIIFSYWKIISHSRSRFQNIPSQAKIFRGKNVQVISPEQISTISLDQGVSRNLLSKRTSQMETEVKLSKTVGIILLVWILAWTPYAIMAIWAMFFDAYGLSPNLGLIPALTCKVSAAVNVLLYGLRLPMFNCEIKKMTQGMIPSCIIVWFAYLVKLIKNRPMAKKHNFSLNNFDHCYFDAQPTKIHDIEYTSQTSKEVINAGDRNSAREDIFNGNPGLQHDRNVSHEEYNDAGKNAITSGEESIVIEFHPPVFVNSIKILTSAQVECSIKRKMNYEDNAKDESEEIFSDDGYNENLGSMLDLYEKI